MHFAEPIVRLKDIAVNFARNNSEEEPAEPVDPDIRSNDELEDLGIAVFNLQRNVMETQENLKNVSLERGRMSAQLSIAGGIQRGVLPSVFPKNPNLISLLQ